MSKRSAPSPPEPRGGSAVPAATAAAADALTTDDGEDAQKKEKKQCVPVLTASKESDAAIVAHSFLLDASGSTAEDLEFRRKCADLIVHAKGRGLSIKDGLTDAARMLVLDSFLNKIYKHHELFLSIEGHDGERLIKNKADAIKAFAAQKRARESSFLVGVHFINSEDKEQLYGNIEFDFSGDLINTIREVDDILLKHIRKAEEIMSDMQQQELCA